MYRFTTPTVTWRFSDTIDMTQAIKMVATIKSLKSGYKLNIFQDDLEISAHEVAVFLTQEDTAKLPTGDAVVMLNWLYNDNGVIKRACAKEKEITVYNNLYDEVLE